MKCFDFTKREEQIKFFSFIFIGIGIVFHIIPYFYNRSLWVDEAMLVNSIINRNFLTLPLSALDFGQSAPLGYLYLVKLITVIFGNGEWQLRILSLLSFVGCLFLIYKILQNIMNVKRPYLFTAIFAFMPYFIRYSNEAKPYMFDVFMVLLVLYAFGMFCNKKLTFLNFILVNAVSVWFSFAAVFYVGSSMIIVCVKILLAKIKNEITAKKFTEQYALCLVVLISFLLNYFLWLNQTKGNAGAPDYWDNLRFPLIPKSLKDIKLIAKMFLQILSPLFPKFFLLASGLMCCLKLGQWIKSKSLSLFEFDIIFAFALVLVASYLGFYPIQDRLVFFVAVTIFIVFVPTVEFCFENFSKMFLCKILCALFMLGILNVMYSSVKRILPSGTYMGGSEVSKNIDFLKNNLSDNDYIYIRRGGMPIFLYESGYKAGNSELVKKLPFESDRLIWGQSTFKAYYAEAYSGDGKIMIEAILEDVALIKKHDSVYIFTSHENAETKEDTQALLGELKKYGSVEIASCFYDTYLYHFSKNLETVEK